MHERRALFDDDLLAACVYAHVWTILFALASLLACAWPFPARVSRILALPLSRRVNSPFVGAASALPISSRKNPWDS